MNEHFYPIYERLLLPEVRIDEVFEDLKRIGSFADDLLPALEAQVEAGNWKVVGRLVRVVFLTVDKRFTPILCRVLEGGKCDECMGEIADLFLDIQDEKSIPCIVRALDYDLWWDSDSSFNRKLIAALEGIGSEAAVEGIKLALRSPKEAMRERAAEALERLGEAN